jgi:hypothetical protein
VLEFGGLDEDGDGFDMLVRLVCIVLGIFGWGFVRDWVCDMIANAIAERTSFMIVKGR